MLEVVDSRDIQVVFQNMFPNAIALFILPMDAASQHIFLRKTLLHSSSACDGGCPSFGPKIELESFLAFLRPSMHGKFARNMREYV